MGGVVDKNVERPEAFDRRVDDPLAVGGRGNVDGTTRTGRAGRVLDRRRRMGERRLCAAGDGHMRAGASEGARDRKADPRPASGHDSDFAGELRFAGTLSRSLPCPQPSRHRLKALRQRADFTRSLDVEIG